MGKDLRHGALAQIEGDRIELDLPVLAPDLTLEIRDVEVGGVSVEGRPLDRAPTRAAFASGTFLNEPERTLVAFDPPARRVRIEIQKR